MPSCGKMDITSWLLYGLITQYSV